MMLTLIVARYNEDVSWVNLIPAHVVIVNKAQLGNTGREASSYLWFIAQHYHSLAGDYLFCQGDPFAHCPDFVERVNGWVGGGAQRSARPTFGPRLTCDWSGAPHHPGLPIVQLSEQEMLDIWIPQKIEFTAGAQFLRTTEEIKEAIPTSGYARHVLSIANTHPQAPWVLERLWDYLIPRRGTGNSNQ